MHGRDSPRKTQGVFIHWYTRVTCALSPWTGKSIGKSSETKVGLPFLSSLLSLLCVCGSKATCLWPCFLPKPLIHFPLFLPTSFLLFFSKYERRNSCLRLLSTEPTHFPETQDQRVRGSRGGREGGSREGSGRERE